MPWNLLVFVLVFPGRALYGIPIEDGDHVSDQEEVDWRPAWRMILKALFEADAGALDAGEDSETRRRLAIAKVTAMADELPALIQSIKPLADMELVDEAVVIMREEAAKAFGVIFTDGDFEN